MDHSGDESIRYVQHFRYNYRFNSERKEVRESVFRTKFRETVSRYYLTGGSSFCNADIIVNFFGQIHSLSVQNNRLNYKFQILIFTLLE
jgi:hypothetical protein